MIASKIATSPITTGVSRARIAARKDRNKSKGEQKHKFPPKAKRDRPPQSKQDRVLAMLHEREGTTIPAVMKATGWQKHSVHGFLSGVVRKKLKLKLESTKVGDQRIYRIGDNPLPKANSRRSKRHPA